MRYRTRLSIPIVADPRNGPVASRANRFLEGILRRRPRTGKSLLADRNGNVLIFAAIILTVVIGCAALTVDVGSLSHDRRSLQSANDVAAMAAVIPIVQTQTYGTTPTTSGLTTIVSNALSGNGYPNAVIDSVVPGTYCPDPSIAPSARFTPGAATCSASVYTGPVPNAVQSNVHIQSPYFFSPAITHGASSQSISSTSVAVGMDEAGFIIGTGLISASTANSPLLNGVLGGMLGTSLSLSAVDYDGLANTQINALNFLGPVATNAKVNVATIGGLASASAGLGTVLQAEITALNQAGTVTTASANALAGLQLLNTAVPGSPSVQMGQLLNASAWETAASSATGANVAPTALAASVNAFQVASAAIQLANGSNSVTVPTSGLGLPGLASLTVASAAGSPTQTAFPGGGVGYVGTGATTSQVNLTLGVQVTPSAINLGVASASLSLSMPTTVTIAYGTAQLTSISCGANPATDATMTVKGTTGLATITTTLTTHVAITLLGLPVLTTNVVVPMTVTVGSGGPTSLSFSQTDVTNQTVKRISSTDVLSTTTSTLASSLASQTNSKITVAVAGISLPVGFLTSLTSSVTSTLSTTIAPLLDTVIDNVAAALGVQVGYMDVMATGIRCGVPAIVD